MRICAVVVVVASACGQQEPAVTVPGPGVVFTYPRDHQVDVPTGARLLVSFSDPVAADAVVSVVGPAGAIGVTPTVSTSGNTVSIVPSALDPGTKYAIESDGAPLVEFTTRSDRPLPGPPALLAIDGSDPATPGTFRPILDVSTLQLVFSEPLDPRSVVMEAGSVELVDAGGTAVPATLLARGIHVVVDPVTPLIAGMPYELRLGDRITDEGGDTMVGATVPFTPAGSLGDGPIRQVFRTRNPGDVDTEVLRTDVINEMDVVHPLIGSVSSAIRPAVIETQLGDPRALGGPIAFTIPRGQRFASEGLDIALAGAVPSGLTTGDIQIELLSDGGGLLYRNRPDTLPDNHSSPLLVDLSLDLAVYATDPTGNAVLAQTILGAQLTGIAIADHGALAIESVGALDINLLGIATAPTNLVLDLISDPSATVSVDSQPPMLVASLPDADSAALDPEQGIELIFDEPIDLDRARAGGVQLRDGMAPVDATIESHGSVIVVRPRKTLLDGEGYRVELTDIADLAGNAMATRTLSFATPAVAATPVPMALEAVYPGAPCALVSGRCAGGLATDDTYQPFTLAADDQIRVVFDRPALASSLVVGTTCDTGAIRIETVDDTGACTGVVPGTLLRHARDLAFVPDVPWVTGQAYRLRLVSGPDATCDAGEICGANGRAARFEPLAGMGTTAGGGPDLIVAFTGAAAASRTTLLASASPAADINGSGQLDAVETAPDTNRVALRIASTSGLITSAAFTGADCVPQTPQQEACMYVAGAIPATLGDKRDNCPLPDGTTAATCVPVEMTPQAMYSTSITMTAAALGIGIQSTTGMSVMRMRQPANAPLEGYIVDDGGTPKLVTALDLYMDAPDMTVPLATSDMHSKQLSVLLEGPVAFQPDGRLALSLSNVADVPITVGITAPLGITGTVKLVVPKGEMKLQLVTPPQRGRLP
jgi:hypothetical protein